jgi:hypothetical protein
MSAVGLRCRACGGTITWTDRMVVCIQPMDSPRCTPSCRACGRDLVRHERPGSEGREYWQHACACSFSTEQGNFEFTPAEIERFGMWVASHSFALPYDVLRDLLNSLAGSDTKVVMETPQGEMVVTAEEARIVIGRDLRST